MIEPPLASVGSYLSGMVCPALARLRTPLLSTGAKNLLKPEGYPLSAVRNLQTSLFEW
jgi:hypothetical protein